MDDDVETDEASLRCLLRVASGDARLIVSLEHSARGFTLRGPPVPQTQVWCAFLPQLVLIPFPYLEAYTKFERVRAFVNRTAICEDYAFGAVAGHVARTAAAARSGGVDAGAAPDSIHAVAAGLTKRGGDIKDTTSLSGLPYHEGRRRACPAQALEAIGSDLAARDLSYAPTFIPSSLTFDCGALAGPANVTDARLREQEALVPLHAKYGAKIRGCRG